MAKAFTVAASRTSSPGHAVSPLTSIQPIFVANQPQAATLPPTKVELDPEDFMDVVTSYRCKFCEELFKSSEELFTHAKRMHFNQGQNITSPKKQAVISNSSNFSAVPLSKSAKSVGVGMDVGTDTAASEETVDEEGTDKEELFLCGQCNLGYTSIEACKQHMETDHGLNMESAVTETMVETPEGSLAPVSDRNSVSGNKVDASTQVCIFPFLKNSFKWNLKSTNVILIHIFIHFEGSFNLIE